MELIRKYESDGGADDQGDRQQTVDSTNVAASDAALHQSGSDAKRTHGAA